jgi:hypothetical protein
MNRVLKRPMFRMGGAAEGITSGLDRKPLKQGTDPYDRAMKTTERFMTQKIKNLGTGDDSRKTAEVEAGIIKDAQKAIFAARDILNNKDSTPDQRTEAERTIKINQNVLQKELGVPAEYAAIISSQELFESNMTRFVKEYNDAQLKKIEEYAKANEGVSEEEIVAMFPLIKDDSVEAQDLTFRKLKERFGFASGGRAGFKLGTEPKMMESVAEQPKGEVQELSYTELRARLPQEISNDIVMLLANSKQALLDFANIQTTEDIASFNQQYDVNLSMPSGA